MKTTNAVSNKVTETEPNSEPNSAAASHDTQACPVPHEATPAHLAAEPVIHDNIALTSRNNDKLHTNDSSHASSNTLAISNVSKKITKKSENVNLASGLSSQHLALARQLLGASIRKRRFRLDSFVAKLTPDQLTTLIHWLQVEEPILSVRDRIAAAPPEGFGLQVHMNTLYRLQNSIRNTELNHWIANTMDATCDILDAETTTDTAPVREAISLLLHSRLMATCRKQSDPVAIDRLLSAITRLEKLKLLARRYASQESEPVTAECLNPVTRHKVELSISTHIPPSHQTSPPEGSGAQPQIHRYSLARDAESI